MSSVSLTNMLQAEFPDGRITLAPYIYYLGLNATTLILVASSIALLVFIDFAALSTFVMSKLPERNLFRSHFEALGMMNPE